jgi:hypothetical protein
MLISLPCPAIRLLHVELLCGISSFSQAVLDEWRNNLCTEHIMYVAIKPRHGRGVTAQQLS